MNYTLGCHSTNPSHCKILTDVQVTQLLIEELMFMKTKYLKIHRLVVADTRLQVPIPAGTDDTLMDVSGSVVIRSHMYFVQNTR